MTTVGLIGSGQIGSAIARLAIEAGHQVVLSNSRGPETLADTAAELGPRASAATSGEAAAAGDIVVVTVPVKAFPDVPAAPLAGKTVIDTCNYGPERDGHIPDLDSKSLTSSDVVGAVSPAASPRGLRGLNDRAVPQECCDPSRKRRLTHAEATRPSSGKNLKDGPRGRPNRTVALVIRPRLHATPYPSR